MSQCLVDGLQKIFEEKFDTRSLDLKKNKTALEIRMVELENEINKVFKLHMDVGASVGLDLIKEKLLKLSEKKSELKRQIDETNLLLDGTPDPSACLQKIEENIGLFHRGWRKATAFQQKSLLHLMFDSLVVAPDGIGAYYKVPSEQVPEDAGPVIQMTSEPMSEVLIPKVYFPVYGVPFPSQRSLSSKGCSTWRVETSRDEWCPLS